MQAIDLLLETAKENGRKLDDVAEAQSAHSSQINTLNKAVFGNGQPGLTQKVSALQIETAATSVDWKYIITSCIALGLGVVAFIK